MTEETILVGFLYYRAMFGKMWPWLL